MKIEGVDGSMRRETIGSKHIACSRRIAPFDKLVFAASLSTA